MQRIFSGIQPSGVPQLGNYLGAIRNWVSLQADHECVFCLVDMHAITVWQEPAKLREHTLMQAAILLASGIDAERHILFNQSAVSAHARLAWIFNCVSRLGWLNRMTQFKDKAGKDRENHSAGLYVYPNLMAADILAYKATRVPVGEDQKQHLELTNDIAQKFNHDYGVDFFPQVEALIPPEAARVMSLRDGTKKMSKSDLSAQSRIELTDDADTIALKIKRAKTDADVIPSDPSGLVDRPEAKNLVSIYAALANMNVQQVLDQHQGQGFGPFKAALTEVVVNAIAPIAIKTSQFLQDEAYLVQMLHNGAQRAQAIAEPIVSEAEKLVGFVKPL
ncbi:tryptophan--tRNA ligase [Acetobacter sp. LMG 32666]|uniref:tryptophan--tRNA ligase n=1 Tax=Acetobacter sp. LMG 32666 TaxID=2959295 RepID=UPI0030C7E200